MAAGLRENVERMGKRRGNGERMRKWKENEEMERDLLPTFPHFLFSSSLSIHFLYQKLSHFVTKCYIRHFCHEGKKTVRK